VGGFASVALLVGGLLLNLPLGLLTNWASNHPEQLPAPVRFVADEPWVPLAVVTALSIICAVAAARLAQTASPPPLCPCSAWCAS